MTEASVEATPDVDKLTTPDANTKLLEAQREIISRKRLKPFTKRTDRHGLMYFGGHMSIIFGTGYLVYLATGTGWLIPTMFLHGVMLGHLFAPMHETSHGTAFRSRWLNETVHWITGILIVWTPTYFRYDHTGHHTHAQEFGQDPEFVLPSPSSWIDYIYYVTGIHQWVKNLGWIFRHSMGRIRPFNRQFVPEDQLPKIFLEARIFLAIYVTVAVISIALGSWAAAIYWAIPTVIGLPVARALRVADHTGCTEGHLDLRTYARTLKTDPLTRFLCWNMPYHCEHHLAPSVPFHALPALHREVGHEMNPLDKGYWAVQWDVIRDHLEKKLRFHLIQST
jgi:fatty acid desaturase